ncbi:hypothetical protein DEU56DRAFT_180237 [Suillus clintonianus]|uniref:uncharacterized protein n=1 Tax=Suillus clintonianus TaxID=1904413 RepID=UPI001B8711CD|nr:uncharacterized protein DEU56DRAFT_180237 [Suillus clintonianus]KAG2114847.1 hypothetical protein DEU56DRAFT_180237 [Suillus clintonianus]
MIFFTKKPKPSALPPGWPSPFHNKCSQRDCHHANNPQTVKGVYQCRGVPGGFYCEGTYKIASTRARETEHYLQEMAMARRSAEEEQRKRKISEMRRPELGARRGGTNMADRRIPDERDCRPGYGQAPWSPTRGTENRRPQAYAPYSGHRPSQSEIESEYRTDQILMHLYPEREIRPRWI